MEEEQNIEEQVTIVAPQVEQETSITEENSEIIEESEDSINEEEKVIVIPEEELDSMGLPIFHEEDLRILKMMNIPVEMFNDTIETARELYISLNETTEDERDANTLDMMNNSKKTLFQMWDSINEMKKNKPSNQQINLSISILIDSFLYNQNYAKEADCVKEEGVGLSIMRTAIQRRNHKYNGLIFEPNKETLDNIQKDITKIAKWYKRVFRFNTPKNDTGSKQEADLTIPKNVIRNMEKIFITPVQFIGCIDSYINKEFDESKTCKGFNGIKKILNQIETTSDFFEGKTELNLFKKKFDESVQFFIDWFKDDLSEESIIKTDAWVNQWSNFKHPHEDDIASDEELNYFYISILKSKSSQIREHFSLASYIKQFWRDRDKVGIEGGIKMPEGMSKEEFLSNMDASMLNISKSIVTILFQLNISYPLFSYTNIIGEMYGDSNFDSGKTNSAHRKTLLEQLDRYLLAQLTFWFWLYSMDGFDASDINSRNESVDAVDPNKAEHIIRNSYSTYITYKPELARDRFFNEYFNTMISISKKIDEMRYPGKESVEYFALYKFPKLEDLQNRIKKSNPDFDISPKEYTQ